MNNDLISRSALVSDFEDYLLMICDSGGLAAASEMLEAVREFPAVDAEPVRHGRWKPTIRCDIFGKKFVSGHACSLCGSGALCECANYDAEEELSNYCPNCGAKMMEGENDGNHV